MGGLLSVSQGSTQEPRFIALEYKGGKGAPVVLIGKGVTFDSGGISIKPADKMEDMKYDMSGAAAVLGVFETLGRLKPKLNVIGPGTLHRESPQRHGAQAGRCGEEPSGQDDRDREHRRGGAAHPV
jgi:leucyl aminopeptidase